MGPGGISATSATIPKSPSRSPEKQAGGSPATLHTKHPYGEGHREGAGLIYDFVYVLTEEIVYDPPRFFV